MKIGLIDIDGRKFPNLALMKISAWHRSQGDSVCWATDNDRNYDRVYASKIFTFTPDTTLTFDCEVIRGGTGYDVNSALPAEIDRLQPDYSLYPQVDKKTAYGFLTRGCPNNCRWCIVPKKEGSIKPYMDVEEIAVDGRTNLVLMDNNILASDFGIVQLEKIVDKGYRIDLNQGNSARLVNDDVAYLFSRIRWLNSRVRFAADTLVQVDEVERAIERIDKARSMLGKAPGWYSIYTIIDGQIKDCYNRLSYFRKFPRVNIVAQPYRDFNNPNQMIPQWQKDMAHWANRHEIYATCDFKEFSPRKGFVCKDYF